MFLFYNGTFRSIQLTSDKEFERNIDSYFEYRLREGVNIVQISKEWNKFIGKNYRSIKTMEDIINFIGTEEISIKIKKRA